MMIFFVISRSSGETGRECWVEMGNEGKRGKSKLKGKKIVGKEVVLERRKKLILLVWWWGMMTIINIITFLLIIMPWHDTSMIGERNLDIWSSYFYYQLTSKLNYMEAEKRGKGRESKIKVYDENA